MSDNVFFKHLAFQAGTYCTAWWCILLRSTYITFIILQNIYIRCRLHSRLQHMVVTTMSSLLDDRTVPSPLECRTWLSPLESGTESSPLEVQSKVSLLESEPILLFSKRLLASTCQRNIVSDVLAAIYEIAALSDTTRYHGSSW